MNTQNLTWFLINEETSSSVNFSCRKYFPKNSLNYKDTHEILPSKQCSVVESVIQYWIFLCLSLWKKKRSFKDLWEFVIVCLRWCWDEHRILMKFNFKVAVFCKCDPYSILFKSLEKLFFSFEYLISDDGKRSKNIKIISKFNSKELFICQVK